MMHGTLTLKSTIGKGSTFTLTLPLPQTGEIMVPPEDMAEFCEDEFNPAAKLIEKLHLKMVILILSHSNKKIPHQKKIRKDRNVQSSTSSSPPNSSSTDSALPASDSSDIEVPINLKQQVMATIKISMQKTNHNKFFCIFN